MAEMTVEQLHAELQKFRREVTANFEHWDGQYRALVKRFNKLARDLHELSEELSLKGVQVN